MDVVASDVIWLKEVEGLQNVEVDAFSLEIGHAFALEDRD